MEKLCEDMQVVVLMGGLATRLGNPKLPKSLTDVYGRPFFEYQLELMIQAGFKKFVFCVGFGAEQIKDYFGYGIQYGIDIKYSCDGDKLLGTGGAIKNALPLLEDNFMVIYGDSFMDVNYFEIIVKYYSEYVKGKRALMTIMENNNKFDKSNIWYHNKEIVAYSKGTNTTVYKHIDYGISIFNKTIFNSCANNFFDLNQVYQLLIFDKLLTNHMIYNRFYEIGTPTSLNEFKEYVKYRWLTPHAAIFLDRDGVINRPVWNDNLEELDSPFKEEDVHILQNVTLGLLKLQLKDYLLFIVTNQPAAAKGKTTYLQLCKVNNYIIQELKKSGVNITGYELCPHYPLKTPNTKEDYLIKKCSCRKPQPNMIYNIMNKYNIDKATSWMIGDAYTDIAAGSAAGLNTAFIGTYKCESCKQLQYIKPNLICKDLNDFSKKLGEEE